MKMVDWNLTKLLSSREVIVINDRTIARLLNGLSYSFDERSAFNIATDKRGYPHNIFLISRHICCGYSLEAPQRGASNEYHNICFR